MNDTRLPSEEVVTLQNLPAVVAHDRAKFIGGSDIAAILGVSPWTTALHLYLEKRGELPPEEVDPKREKIFKRGKRAEPHAIDMLIEDLGIDVTRRSTEANPNRYIDPEHPFLAAEVDFEWTVTQELADIYELDPALIGTTQNGEVKSVHPFAAGKFGEMNTDEIPIEYAAQAMHGLGVTGRAVTMFVVLAGWDDLTLYWIKRDDETIAALRSKAVSFWHDNLLAGVPPEPVNLDDVLQLFERKAEVTVAADDAMLALYSDFLQAKRDAAAADEAAEDLKFRIGVAMLGANRMAKPAPTAKHVLKMGDATILSIDFRSQKRINTDLLKEKYPQAAAACMKTSELFQFNLPRRKKP